MLNEDGLDGISISKVAKRSKIGKGTVYLYFDSKEEIIGAITVKARKKLLEYFKQYCEAESDHLDKIRAIFIADYHFYKEHYTYHELVSFYERNTGLSEEGELSEMSQEITTYLTQILIEAQKQGAIRADINCLETTFMFWGTIYGILQLIDIKHKQIHDVIQKSEWDFFNNFVEYSINSLT